RTPPTTSICEWLRHAANSPLPADAAHPAACPTRPECAGQRQGAHGHPAHGRRTQDLGGTGRKPAGRPREFNLNRDYPKEMANGTGYGTIGTRNKGSGQSEWG